MARIRSIKPEIVQSQSLARVSREARLTFILLMTQADDSGRLGGSSRMFASLLFPADEDAPKLIDGWFAELEAVGCIRRYSVDGAEYLDLPKWLKHQKIDKPSPSRLPAFDESSRAVAEPSRIVALDQDLGSGPRTKDHSVPSEPRKGPIDLQAELWKSARKLMADRGVESARAGPLIGKWLKSIGPPDAGPTLLAILAGAEANCHGDLIPYVEMAVRNRWKANGKLNPDQQRAADRAAILRGLGLDAPARGTGPGGNGGPNTGGARKRAAIAGTIV